MALLATLYGSLFSGFTSTVQADGSLLIQSAPGRFVAWLIAFPAILLVTGVCWRKRLGGRYAPSFFIASFTIPAIVLPGIDQERILITPDAISIRTGFWFSPTEIDFSLRSLKRIRIASTIVVKPRGIVVTENHWHFEYIDADERIYPPSDLFDHAEPVIEECLLSHGIKVDRD